MSEAHIQSEKHQLRLSIDIRSLKDHDFTAQMYLRYGSIQKLGIRSFRSAPSVQVTNPHVETALTNCFVSSYFEAGSGEVEEKLDEKLPIEVWHNDRHKKDVMLGLCVVELKDVLKVPLRKKHDSFARVFDAYLPVDETDPENDNKPIRKVGTLRVLVYLQDLGPLNMLKKRGFDVNELLEQPNDNEMAEVVDPKLPSESFEGTEKQRKELNELEYKVVWELETWKKAEEAKTRITLKQKEIEFWTNLSEQQKKSDIEKEKHFKKLEANLNILEGKLKAKMAELQKREQKIVVYEQQLQNKINEVSKECFHKDEEIERIRRKNKEEKTSMTKEKSGLELELSKFRAENAKLRIELEEARKVDEKSPLNLLKNELNIKSLEIKELSKELQRCGEIKEEYKVYYEKMKNEMINHRDKLKEAEESIREIRHEKDILHNNYKNLEQKVYLYEKQQQCQSHNRYQHYYEGDNFYNENEGYWGYEEERGGSHSNNKQYLSEKERLIKVRQQLIDDGSYNQNDDLIREYDRNIAKL